MGIKENNKKNEILLNLKPNERLFRVNSGRAWQGEVIRNDGSVLILKHPRPFMGMPAGTSDLIGFTSIEITSEMIGQKVAVFTAVEIKTEAYKIVTSKQSKFGKMVQSLGGIFKVVS